MTSLPLRDLWGGRGAICRARGRLQPVSRMTHYSSMLLISSILLQFKCLQFHADADEHATGDSQAGIVPFCLHTSACRGFGKFLV